MKYPRYVAITLLAMVFAGCESTYYNTMERFGVHKREILVDRVEEARDSQQEAQETFRSALDQFKSMTGFNGGDLEQTYEDLNDEYEASKSAAETIRERIEAVDSVAGAMFEEWEEELSLYSNANLRRDSESKLRETRRKYALLLGAMRKAEQRMDPVLTAMGDQVLYLKHNLNARAIQSLKGEVANINRSVDNLLSAMEQAIAEADAFIVQMQTG